MADGEVVADHQSDEKDPQVVDVDEALAPGGLRCEGQKRNLL